MGPSNADEADTLVISLQRLREIRQARPEMIVTYPSDTPSRLWGVSLPGMPAMAFSDVSTMIEALDGRSGGPGGERER